MIQYINNDEEVTVHVAGNMTQICADVTYLIHKIWVGLGKGGDEFKQRITACINESFSPVFQKGNAMDIPVDNAMENAMDNALSNASDLEATAWKEEMDLYEEAVKHFGQTAQIMQAIEEMAELTQALNKYLRYNQFGQGNLIDALKKIQEERADVEIMLNQLHVIFGDNSKTECEKLEHLRELLHPNKSWEV